MLPYLQGYPPELVQRVQDALLSGTLGDWLLAQYPKPHAMRTDSSLFSYAQTLRLQTMRNAAPLSKVAYDSKLQVMKNALGTHSTIARVQGAQLKTKREIRIASVFRDSPEEFLRMIVVHELAHLRERAHDKAFYALCTHMEPRYHQYEFGLRAYLSLLEHTGQRLWEARD